MCAMKTVQVSVARLLAGSFCIDRALKEKNVGQQSKHNNKNPCEIEYKSFWLNGDCYYLLQGIF